MENEPNISKKNPDGKLTFFTAQVIFNISASEDPSEVFSQFQFALNEACTYMANKLKKRFINYKIKDTFTEVS